MKKNIFILLISIYAFPLAAETTFEQGENLLLNNKLNEAAMMFEASIDEDRSNPQAYLYLGYIYETRNDYSSAVSILSRGASEASGKKDQIYNNLGINYFKLGDYGKAADAFSKAIQSRSGYAEPYLNRANSRVKTQEYTLAARDYNLYLNLKPSDPQRPQIEKMISLLNQTIADAEARRKEEEQRRLAEEARQKALLDSVLNSLSNAGSDTTNLSADTEKIQDVDIELDIED